MTTIRLKILFLAILTTTLTIGCSKNNEAANEEDIVLQSYRLIDDQRTDEAIQLLEAELAKDPENYQYRVTLASAYAHKGGLKIQKFIPAVTQAEKLSDLEASMTEVKKKKSMSLQVSTMAKNAAKLLTQFSNFFELYAAIPVIDQNQATYITHSVYLLNETKDKITKEDALYRAVLSIILFKYSLDEHFIAEFTNVDENQCRLELGNINDAFVELGKILISIVTDIGYATDDKDGQMTAMGEDIADTVSSLTLATTSLMVIDEASNIFLQEAIIQNGFGKLIKCGGD